MAQIQCVIVPWLAPIFDVHPEQHSPGYATTLLTLPVAHAREGDLVGRRASRFRSRQPVSRIAHTVNHRPGAVVAIGVDVRGQARAIQSVEEASMEVAFPAALLVAHMRPAAMDARIAQEVVGQTRVDDAYLVAHRRADLAAVRHIPRIGRANLTAVVQVLTATAGHTADCRGNTKERRAALRAGRDVRSTDVMRAELTSRS